MPKEFIIKKRETLYVSLFLSDNQELFYQVGINNLTNRFFKISLELF